MDWLIIREYFLVIELLLYVFRRDKLGVCVVSILENLIEVF